MVNKLLMKMPYNYAHKCKTITYVDNFKYRRFRDVLAEKHFTYIHYYLPSIFFSQVKANVLTVKVEELSLVNSRLEEELKTSQHSQLMEGEKGLETLKLRNKFLQVK